MYIPGMKCDSNNYPCHVFQAALVIRFSATWRAVRKTTLEKAVAVLRLLEGGEGSVASADTSRFREDSQSGM